MDVPRGTKRGGIALPELQSLRREAQKPPSSLLCWASRPNQRGRAGASGVRLATFLRVWSECRPRPAVWPSLRATSDQRAAGRTSAPSGQSREGTRGPPAFNGPEGTDLQKSSSRNVPRGTSALVRSNHPNQILGAASSQKPGKGQRNRSSSCLMDPRDGPHPIRPFSSQKGWEGPLGGELWPPPATWKALPHLLGAPLHQKAEQRPYGKQR